MASSETKHYRVTATFIDKETGETILPGSLFAATPQRAQRLRSAGVIEELEEKKSAPKKGKKTEATDPGGDQDGKTTP